MKRKLLAILMILVLILTMAACGSPDPGTDEGGEQNSSTQENQGEENTEPEPEPVDYEAVYAPLLDEIYDAVYNGNGDESETGGLLSVYIASRSLVTSDRLSAIGWRMEDINGDAVQELLIGYADTLEDGKAFGDQILAMYTVKDEEPVCVLEGFERNVYQWAGSGKFYFWGSGGAAYHGTGIFTLPQGETVLTGTDFYFTDFKDESMTDIGVFHNETGVWEKEEAELTELTLDELWELEASLAESIEQLELTQMSSYKDASLLDSIPFWVEEAANSPDAAAAFLGYVEGDAAALKNSLKERGILDRYPFLNSIDEDHVILLEGGEWYAVIPAPDVKLTVSEGVMDMEDWNLKKGEQLYEAEDGEPILIRGNVSEIYSNIMVHTSRNGADPAQYSLQRSMMDGSLYTEPWILDFTPYDLFENYLIEVMMNPTSGRYHYYLEKAIPVSTPVVGNDDPDPIIITGLKDVVNVRVEMVKEGSGYGADAKVKQVLLEWSLYPGDALAVSAELMPEDTPLRVAAESEDGKVCYWYAVAPNGGGYLHELAAAY